MAKKGLVTQRMGLEFDKEKTWFITHVEESSGLFYLHLMDPSISVKYERLYQEIEGAALSNQLRDFVSLAQIGDLCLAKFSEDEQWYRAQILSVDTEAEEVEVFFIDYGNGEFTGWKSLKILPEEFSDLPAQAWQCRLANVEPVGGVWCKEAVDLLKELILERELKGVPSHLCKSGTIVMKLFADEEKSVLVAQQLVMAGFAHWKKSHSRASSSPSSSSSSSTSLSINVKPGQLGQIKVKEGRYLDLCVSYCESPDAFFCQPLEHSDDLTAMQDELQTYYTVSQATDLAGRQGTVGQICCARFSDDQSWYRGIIRSVCEDSMFEVQFIDFGNSEVLPLKEIKVLSPTFLQLPILGLKCSLYGINPQSRDPVTSANLATKFEELTFEKQLVAHVKEVNEAGNISIILFDTTGKDEININNELVKSGLATSLYPTENLGLPRGKSSSSQSASPPTVQPKYVPMIIDEGFTELSYVVFGSNPFNFYCQFAKNADALENMMQELNDEYCKLKPTESQLKLAKVGMPCCAKYDEDGRYYRAEILSVTDTTAKIHFVDYGNDDECAIDVLKHLKKEYLKLPKQAFKCTLNGIQRMELGIFSAEANSKFTEVVLDKEFNLTTVKVTYSVVHVNLVEQNERNIATLDVAKILVEGGYAEPARTNLSGTGEIVTSGEYKEITVPLKEYIDVVPTEITDLNQFCCQMVEQADEIDAMMAALDETYKRSEPNANITWKSGMPVAALYPVDGVWYRAVLSRLSRGQAEVTYVDFGNSEKISVNDIRPLYSDFMKLPAQAFVCCLDDVKPKQGQEWTVDAIDTFSNLVVEKHLIAFVKRKDQSNIHLIDLLDTMSNRKQQLNISDLLIEKGVAQRPGSNLQANTPMSSSVPRSTASKEVESYSVNVKDVETVLVSFVENPSSFYLQLSSSMTRIDEIAEELDVQYSQLASGDQRVSAVANGKLVAVKYSADGYWYRGQIEDKVDSNKVHVMYIDHGNSEDVSISEIKELNNSLAKDPGFAIHCSLNQIFPTSGSWNDASIAGFNQLVEEKTLQAKFITKTPPCKVELLDNSIDIAAELVNKNLAVKSKTSSQSAAGFTDVKLNVGDTERVYVSHVDDLGSFFCQLERLEGKLDTVMEAVSEVCASAKPLSSIQPSQAVCAMFSEDEAWYRGQILKTIDNTTAHVCFVDYGNSENVNISNMRQIPNELLKEPKFAICCSIYNDNNKKLKDNAVSEFTQRTVDKVLKMTVKAKQGDRIVVELCDESGVNLAADLFLKTSPSASNSLESVMYPSQTVRTNVAEDLYVTHTNTLTDLYVQLVSQSDALDNIMIALEESNKVKLPPDQLKPGMPCVAVFSEDSGWYRGIVDQCSAAKATVRFVDYGNSEEKNVNEIYQLAEDLATEAPFAIHCFLKGASADAPATEVEKFKESVFDKHVTGKLLTKPNGKYELELKDFSFSSAGATYSASTVSIPTIQVSGQSFDGYISHTESLNEFYVQLDINVSDLDQVAAKMAEIAANMAAYPSLADAAVGQFCCAKFSEDGNWYRGETLEMASDKCKVRFIDYGNTDMVPARELKAIPKDASLFPKLAIRCKLNGNYNNADSDIEKFVNITMDQLLSITFVDTVGDSYRVKINHEGKVLNEIFDQAKSLVVKTPVKAPLQATASNDLAPKSPAVIVEYADSSLKLGQKYNVVVPYFVSNEEFYCQQSTDLGSLDNVMGELESHYGSLNENEERLMSTAVPGMPCAAKFSEDGLWYRAMIEEMQNQNEVKVRFVDYGNNEVVKLAEIKSLSPELLDYPMFAFKCGLVLNGQTDSSFLEEACDVKIIALVDSKYMIERWDSEKGASAEPANKAVSGDSGVAATHSFKTVKFNPNDSEKVYFLDGTSPLEFYCHLVRYEDDLANLCEDMANEAGSFQVIKMPNTGLPCVGLFSEDESWYRGRITETQADKSKVFFVDYANEEWVSNSNIKVLSEKMLQLPIQAVKCSLSQYTGVNKPDEDLSLMREKCGEDVLSIQIVSADNDIMSVILKNENTGEIINEAFKSTANNNSINRATMPGNNTVQSFKDPPVKQGATFDVCCYFVKSTQIICCQIISLQEQLDALMENIQTYCSSNKNPLTSPAVDLVCLALFEDGTWYRATIKAVSQDIVTVRFVDYGNEASVALKDLRDIRPEDLDLPVTCIDCYFADSLKLNLENTSIIEDICYEHTLSVTIDKIVSPGVVSGEVFPKDSQESIRQILMGKFPVENVDAVGVDAVVVDASVKKTQDSGNLEKPKLKMPEIESGKTLETFCTFVTDNAELCCQLGNTQEQLDLLMEEIATYGSGSKDYLKDPTEGQACLAKYSADEGWYRAEVTKVNKANNAVTVDFVDYGNSEDTTTDNLLIIPPEFLQQPACCIKVCIAGVDVGIAQVAEIKDWLEENCLEQMLHLKDLLGDGRRFKGKITTVESSLDVNNVIMEKFEMKKTADAPSAPVEKMEYLKPEILKDTEERILCTHVTSANTVSCHLLKYEEEFGKMMDDIAEYCGNCDKVVSNPAVGQACLGRFPVDGGWYRAKLLCCSGDVVKLKYVDYDNEEDVSYADLREMKSEFMKLPRACVPCLLHDVHNEDLDQEKAKQWLEESCMNNEYKVKFVEVDGDCVEVNMYYPGSEDTVNDELYAKFALEETEVADIASENQPTAVSIPEETIPASTDNKKPSVESDDVEPIADDLVDADVKTTLRYSAPVFDSLSNISAVCSYIDDDLTVHCQLSEYIAELDTLMAHIADYCAEVTTRLNDTTPGLACFAQFPDDLEWYRAEILKKEGDMIRVFFVDYGNSTLVTEDQLRVVDQSFLLLPRACIACNIQGTREISESTENVKAWMGENLLIEKPVEINILESLKDGSFKVTLTVDGSDFASLLDAQFKNLPVASEKNEVAETATTETAVSPVASQDMLSPDERNISTVLNKEQQTSTYTLPVLAAGDKIDVICTHIDSPKEIFCQLVKYHADLDALAEQIADHCSKEIQSPAVAVGCACLARFSVDQQWYRAEVRDISSDKVTVFMVDYGNLDTVSLTDIRLATAEATQLPVTSVKCQLHDVHDEDLDIKSAMEWLHGNVLESELKLEVVGVMDGSYDCVLMKPNAEISVNDELYALYALDVEEAVIESKVEPPNNEVAPAASVDVNSEVVAESRTDTVATPDNNAKFNHAVLSTDNVETVHCTHIESTKHIYCQLVKYHPQIDEMSLKFEEYSTDERNRLSKVDIGTACLARFSEDQQWYRAEVTAVDGDKIQVLFVDYGNSDTIAVTETRRVTSEFTSVPAAAVLCQLHDVHDEDLDIKAATNWLRENVAEHEFVLETVEKIDDVYDCVFKRPGEDISINDTLYAQFSLSDEPTEEAEATTELTTSAACEQVNNEAVLESDTNTVVTPNDNIQYSHSVLSSDNPESVHCTHVESTKHIYCQLVKYHPQIDEMSLKFEEYSTDESNRLSKVDIGAACLARFSEDQQWYRAEVTAVDGDQIQVLFVDYGNSDTIPVTETRAITSEFTSVPAAAVLCQLHDVHDEDLDIKAATTWLHENIAQHEFVLETVGKIDDVYDCVFKRPGEDMSINNTLYAQFSLSDDPTEEAEVFPDIKPPATPKLVIPSKEIDIDACLTMHLSLATSPSNFWCQFDETSQDLLQLMAAINGEAAELEGFETTPAISGFCCAKYDEDNQWYRGEVVAACSDSELLVKFVDYGNVEKLSLDKIKVLHAKHHELSRQAVECALYGVKPNTEDGTWSADSIAEFEHICAERLLKVHVIKKEAEKIQVVVTVDESEASVNQIMINNGFAVKDDSVANGFL